VLELHLFESMVANLVQSTKDILDEVRGHLSLRLHHPRGGGEALLSLSTLTSDEYFATRSKWDWL